MTLTAHPPIGAAGPGPLTAPGMHVLLVYGARIRIAHGDKPGIRVTAGYSDGSVLLEAVGFATGGEAQVAIEEAARACKDADMIVQAVPYRLSNFPARRVRRRPA
jgi:hypothetical protein